MDLLSRGGERLSFEEAAQLFKSIQERFNRYELQQRAAAPAAPGESPGPSPASPAPPPPPRDPRHHVHPVLPHLVHDLRAIRESIMRDEDEDGGEGGRVLDLSQRTLTLSVAVAAACDDPAELLKSLSRLSKLLARTGKPDPKTSAAEPQPADAREGDASTSLQDSDSRAAEAVVALAAFFTSAADRPEETLSVLAKGLRDNPGAISHGLIRIALGASVARHRGNPYAYRRALAAAPDLVARVMSLGAREVQVRALVAAAAAYRSLDGPYALHLLGLPGDGGALSDRGAAAAALAPLLEEARKRGSAGCGLAAASLAPFLPGGPGPAAAAESEGRGPGPVRDVPVQTAVSAALPEALPEASPAPLILVFKK